MKALSDTDHELVFDPNLDNLCVLSQEIPSYFETINANVVPDLSEVSYVAVPLDNDYEVPDGRLSLTCKTKGAVIRSCTIALSNGKKPYAFFDRASDGEWSSTQDYGLRNDTDVLSYLVARAQKPTTETARKALNDALSNPFGDDIVGYGEHVLRESANTFTSTQVYTADCARFASDGSFETYQVELDYIHNGGTAINQPVKLLYLLCVTRPVVIGGEATTEYLQLALSEPVTALTNRAYELPDGTITQAPIEDGAEFLQQMQAALEYLIEQKCPMATPK